VTREDMRWVRKAGLASSMGLILVASILIGYFFGSWLDSKLGTSPYLMMLFTLLGIAAGFVEMVRIAIQLSRD